jgi:hypothetical protein
MAKIKGGKKRNQVPKPSKSKSHKLYREQIDYNRTLFTASIIALLAIAYLLVAFNNSSRINFTGNDVASSYSACEGDNLVVHASSSGSVISSTACTCTGGEGRCLNKCCNSPTPHCCSADCDWKRQRTCFTTEAFSCSVDCGKGTATATSPYCSSNPPSPCSDITGGVTSNPGGSTGTQTNGNNPGGSTATITTGSWFDVVGNGLLSNVFQYIFGTPLNSELSGTIITIAVWLILFFTFGDIIATFSSFSVWVSWVIAGLMTLVAANVGLLGQLMVILTSIFVWAGAVAVYLGLGTAFVAFVAVNFGAQRMKKWIMRRKAMMMANKAYAGGKVTAGTLRGLEQIGISLQKIGKP